MMLVQFSVWPLDSPHMSHDCSEIAQVLNQVGVPYQVNAVGTTVEGEWHEVMEAIHACHQTVRSHHQRVVTNITIDDDATRPLHLKETVAKVKTGSRP